MSPRGVETDKKRLEEWLEKGVILIAGEGSFDLDDNDPVYIGIAVEVSGYGPHVGAIFVEQNRYHASADSALQGAVEVFDEYMRDDKNYQEEWREAVDDKLKELAKERGFNVSKAVKLWKADEKSEEYQEAMEWADTIQQERIDGVVFKLKASDAAIVLRSSKDAMEYITVPAPRILTTFQTVTPGEEDGDDPEVENGWIDDEGYEIEADDDESVAEVAAKFILREYGTEPSSSHFHSGIWYSESSSSDPTDWRTGETTTKSFHLKGFSEEEEKQIFKIISKA